MIGEAQRRVGLALAAGALLIGGCDRVYRYSANGAADAAPADLAPPDGGPELSAGPDASQPDALADVRLPDALRPDREPDAPPLPFGCDKVMHDLGLSASSQVLLDESFERYPLGGYPSAPWVNFWSGQDAVVSAEQAFSVPQSFELSATAAWARYDGVPFSAPGYARACYELRVMTTHPDKASKAGFAWKTSPSTTGHYAGLEVGGTNSPYATGTWHHVVADVDLVADSCRFAVDGVFGAAASCGGAANLAAVTHFIIGVTNFTVDPTAPSVVYFDDVRLVVVPAS